MTNVKICDFLGFCIPNKLFADGAESWLRKERRAELVTLDHVNFGLLYGAASLMESEQTLSLTLGLRVSVRVTHSIWNAYYNFNFKEEGKKQQHKKVQFYSSFCGESGETC